MKPQMKAREIAYRQQALQAALGAGGLRLDANEVAFLERELRHLETTVLKREYPALKHRDLFGRTDVPRGADTVAYRMTEQVRRAIILAGQGVKDIPRADVFSTEWPTPMRPVASSFNFDVFELQRASFANFRIDQERGNATRDSIEQQMNDIAFYGDAVSGLPGALTNENVPSIACVAFSGQTVWNNSGTIKGAEGIAADVTSMMTQVRSATNGLYELNKVVLPTELMSILKIKPWSVSGGSDITLFQFLTKNFPQITFEETYNLDAANPLAVSAGVDGNIMGYADDTSVIDELIAADYETMEPVREGLGWTTYAYGITGGVRIRKPKAAVYLTGATA